MLVRMLRQVRVLSLSLALQMLSMNIFMPIYGYANIGFLCINLFLKCLGKTIDLK